MECECFSHQVVQEGHMEVEHAHLDGLGQSSLKVEHRLYLHSPAITKTLHHGRAES